MDRLLEMGFFNDLSTGGGGHPTPIEGIDSSPETCEEGIGQRIEEIGPSKGESIMMISPKGLFALVALCLVTWSQSITAQSKPHPGGRVTYGAQRTIRTTNPFQSTYSIDYTIRSLVFEGLTGTDKEGNIVPCLAGSWEVSKDGLVYTFALRPGVKFHNGQPFGSADVKWSIDYLRNPKNRAYFYNQFTEVESVEATGPMRVVFRLKRPFSPLIATVATTRAPILPAESRFPPDSYPPGTGPFRFVEWRPGRDLKLRAFKDYWIARIPYLDEVVFRTIQDDDVRVTALRTKAVDLADEIPYQIVAEAQKGGTNFNLVTHEAGVRARIVFNTRIPPFNELRVRQAVAYAIDKAEIAAGATWGFAKPTNQRYPRGTKWFVDVKDRDQDLEKAKAFLAEAGHKDGFRVKMPVHGPPGKEITVILKDELKKVGIEIELDTMDFASHTKFRNSRRFLMYAAGMGLRVDPDQMYYSDLYSKAQGNDSGYVNTELDRLLDQARAVLDFKERKRLYTDAVQIVQRDVPEIYLYLGPNFTGVAPHVKGYSTGFLEDRVAFIGGGLPYSWLQQ